MFLRYVVLFGALAALSDCANLTCTSQSQILSSGVFLLGPCPSTTPISITINAANVELSVVDSAISSITSTQATNLWISLTRVAISGVLPVVSSALSNYTLALQQCTVSITSSLDLLYLTRATTPASNFYLSIRSTTVYLSATSSAFPTLGLVQFSATLTNSSIIVESSTITTSWSGTTSTAQAGIQADVNLVWMSGGGANNSISFSNVNSTLTGSGNNVIVLANTQILSSTRVTLTQVNSAVTAVGPRKIVYLDSGNLFGSVSREASLVVVESGGAGIVIALSKCTLIATIKQSPVQVTAGQTSLIDILMSFLVRFISRDGTVTVDTSSMSITIPTSGGMAGIASVIASAAVASLTVNLGGGGVSGVTLQNVAIRLTTISVNVAIGDSALCGYSRTFTVMNYPLTTSNAGAALLFAVVSVGLDSSNISISVDTSTLAYTPPKFSLCPNVAMSQVTAFSISVPFALPSYNTTVLATVLLGSPVDLLITMIRTMFTGLNNAFPSFGILSGLQPAAATMTSLSIVQVINPTMYTDTSNAPIFGTNLASSWYAAVVAALKIHYSTPLSLAIDYPSSLMIVPALLMQTIELGYSSGVTIVRIDQRTSALTTTNAFVPSVVLLDNITDITSSQQKMFNVAISRLSATLTVPNGYVFARDLYAVTEWNFYSLKWSTSFVNRTFSGSTMSVASAPLMVLASSSKPIFWPAQSSIALRCVYCNGVELRRGTPTIFGTNVSTYVAPSTAVLFRQCELTRTFKYVTTTRRLVETASMAFTVTETLTLPPLHTPSREPTPTIDPNFTDATVGLSIGNFESSIVNIAYAAPLLTAAGALQRSYGVLRVATRCATIDRVHRVRTADGDPLMHSAAENPLQLKLGSGFIDELHLNYVAGGVVGNAIFVLICGVFTVVLLLVWNCLCNLLDNEGLSVKITHVFASGMLAAYAGLLQPSISGAVGAIALVPSTIPKTCCTTGNIVLGVGACLLWLMPLVAVTYAFFQWDDEDAFENETLRIVGEQVNRRITRRDRLRSAKGQHNDNWGLPHESPDSGNLSSASVKALLLRWLCGDTIAVLPRRASTSHRVLLVVAGWQFRPGFHWFYVFLLLYHVSFGTTIGALWWTPDTKTCQQGTWALLAFVLLDLVVLLVARPFRSYFDLTASLMFECFTGLVVVLSAAGQQDSAEIVSKVQTVLTIFAFVISAFPFYFRSYHKRQPPAAEDENMFVELGLPLDGNNTIADGTVIIQRQKSKKSLKPQLHHLLLAADPPESLRPYVFVEEWHALKMTSIAHAHACLGRVARIENDKHCARPRLSWY
ncbi:membrane-associated protein, putative [Bodo saltans]|uniref:Membrane-associated protein, putative n=1 Tax=Bodo saltans TaxID=75058 RepID=A0A0S4JQP7_BODSA|nr:membrane-associated protein, putative [Bodo saltans]|eukprot:CUG93846.1 membrane-associated protein, putative [Bodo saltans]